MLVRESPEGAELRGGRTVARTKEAHSVAALTPVNRKAHLAEFTSSSPQLRTV